MECGMTALPASDDDSKGAAVETRARVGTHTGKRMIDVALALLCLVVLSPVFLIAWSLVVTTSEGPGFFRQRRVGLNMEPFDMLKFRTMRVGTSDEAHRAYVSSLLDGTAECVDGLYKLKDERTTGVGRVLRRTSLDELPQLLNVLRGDMSLVGPRPALPWEAELFPDWSCSRYRVPPGITGLWQVNGRNALTMLKGLELDVEYVQRRSITLDLAIIVKTIPVLLRGAGR
jgi:lipopolysaccharide/colanic/teichoic acid biosynthesis glycosyltransferase